MKKTILFFLVLFYTSLSFAYVSGREVFPDGLENEKEMEDLVYFITEEATNTIEPADYDDWAKYYLMLSEDVYEAGGFSVLNTEPLGWQCSSLEGDHEQNALDFIELLTLDYLSRSQSRGEYLYDKRLNRLMYLLCSNRWSGEPVLNNLSSHYLSTICTGQTGYDLNSSSCWAFVNDATPLLDPETGGGYSPEEKEIAFNNCMDLIVPLNKNLPPPREFSPDDCPKLDQYMEERFFNLPVDATPCATPIPASSVFVCSYNPTPTIVRKEDSYFPSDLKLKLAPEYALSNLLEDPTGEIYYQYFNFFIKMSNKKDFVVLLDELIYDDNGTLSYRYKERKKNKKYHNLNLINDATIELEIQSVLDRDFILTEKEESFLKNSLETFNPSFFWDYYPDSDDIREKKIIRVIALGENMGSVDDPVEPDPIGPISGPPVLLGEFGEFPKTYVPNPTALIENTPTPFPVGEGYPVQPELGYIVQATEETPPTLSEVLCQRYVILDAERIRKVYPESFVGIKLKGFNLSKTCLLSIDNNTILSTNYELIETDENHYTTAIYYFRAIDFAEIIEPRAHFFERNIGKGAVFKVNVLSKVLEHPEGGYLYPLNYLKVQNVFMERTPKMIGNNDMGGSLPDGRHSVISTISFKPNENKIYSIGFKTISNTTQSVEYAEHRSLGSGYLIKNDESEYVGQAIIEFTIPAEYVSKQIIGLEYHPTFNFENMGNEGNFNLIKIGTRLVSGLTRFDQVTWVEKIKDTTWNYPAISLSNKWSFNEINGFNHFGGTDSQSFPFPEITIQGIKALENNSKKAGPVTFNNLIPFICGTHPITVRILNYCVHVDPESIIEDTSVRLVESESFLRISYIDANKSYSINYNYTPLTQTPTATPICLFHSTAHPTATPYLFPSPEPTSTDVPPTPLPTWTPLPTLNQHDRQIIFSGPENMVYAGADGMDINYSVALREGYISTPTGEYLCDKNNFVISCPINANGNIFSILSAADFYFENIRMAPDGITYSTPNLKIKIDMFHEKFSGETPSLTYSRTRLNEEFPLTPIEEIGALESGGYRQIYKVSYNDGSGDRFPLDSLYGTRSKIIAKINYCASDTTTTSCKARFLGAKWTFRRDDDHDFEETEEMTYVTTLADIKTNNQKSEIYPVDSDFSWDYIGVNETWNDPAPEEAINPFIQASYFKHPSFWSFCELGWQFEESYGCRDSFIASRPDCVDGSGGILPGCLDDLRQSYLESGCWNNQYRFMVNIPQGLRIFNSPNKTCYLSGIKVIMAFKGNNVIYNDNFIESIDLGKLYVLDNLYDEFTGGSVGIAPSAGDGVVTESGSFLVPVWGEYSVANVKNPSANPYIHGITGSGETIDGNTYYLWEYDMLDHLRSSMGSNYKPILYDPRSKMWLKMKFKGNKIFYKGTILEFSKDPR